MLNRSSLAAALALAVLVGSAHADSEARQGSDWVRLSALPCKNEKVLELITAAGEDGREYRAARAEFGGAPFAPCWRLLKAIKSIHVRYEDGDQGLIDFDDFKLVEEI